MTYDKLLKAIEFYIKNRKKSEKVMPPIVKFEEKLDKLFPQDYHSPYPYYINWSPTCECNLRCKHCFHYYAQEFFSQKEKDLSLDECYKFIDAAANFKILQLTISGGEPFYRKDIFKILSYIKQKRIPLHLQTNGTLFTETKVKRLKNILNLRTDQIQVSLDGATPKTNDEIRGKGSFKKTIAGIKLLLENQIPVVLNYTVTRKNQHELLKFYKLANDLKIPFINFNRFDVVSPQHSVLSPDEQALMIEWGKVIKYSKKKESKTKILGDLFGSMIHLLNIGIEEKDEEIIFFKYKGNSVKKLRCICYPRGLIVNAHGEATLCGRNTGIVLGNLHNNTLEEIWGNRFNNILVKGREAKNLVCAKCEYLDACYGGCAAWSLDINGDINTPDPRCKNAKKLMDRF